MQYKVTSRNSTEWPPRFMKVKANLTISACLSDSHLQFILHVISPFAPTVQIAFLDARRLGRIRLCKTPLTEPPISNLGFDPILSMPDLEHFKKGLLKRSCPVKALLLDQSFSAGVGNWVAGERVYYGGR